MPSFPNLKSELLPVSNLQKQRPKKDGLMVGEEGG